MSPSVEPNQLSVKGKHCPLEQAVNTISGKWKIPIIWHLQKGSRRPSELLRDIENVDRRVLNQHLGELVADGVIVKTVFNELPPKVEYNLSETGESLVKVLWHLNEWGKTLQ